MEKKKFTIGNIIYNLLFSFLFLKESEREKEVVIGPGDQYLQ